MGRNKDLKKRLERLEKLESKLYRRIDTLQRNLMEIKRFKAELEKVLDTSVATSA